MNRAVAIIPNEEILNVSVFYRDVLDSEFHTMKVQEFSDKYHLGITFESLGVEEGYYGGILWQTKLTSLGHAIVCHGDPVVVYLPNLLSDNQYKWFLDYKNFFIKHRKNLSYIVVGNQQEVIESNDVSSKNNTFRLLYNAIVNYRGGGILIPKEESEELKR